MQTNTTSINKLMITERKVLEMNGVDTVDGFTDQYLKLTVNGNKMLITGDNIKISSFNKENGNLRAEGLFSQIKFSDKKVPLIKKIFK